jgi:hypothetical protein
VRQLENLLVELIPVFSTSLALEIKPGYAFSIARRMRS